MTDATAMNKLVQLELDISQWVESELAKGADVPDFWDELNTSERLAKHLIALGYSREAA